jgi:hypothetical protein
MIPHFIWLRQVDFVPFTYAGDTYALSNRMQSVQLVLGYIGHNLALLALPVVLAAAVIAWRRSWWTMAWRAPRGFVAQSWSRSANPGVRTDQALNVWLIQAIVAIGPPVGAMIFDIYLKTDWGISLFFLVPLSVIAIPTLRVRRAALARLAAVWLVLTLAVLATAPQIALLTLPRNADGTMTHGSHSQLARELTDVWHQRFHSRWPVVAAYTDVGDPMTFYSVDHPVPLTPNEAWSSGLSSLDEAKRDGFIGICEVGGWHEQLCGDWMKVNAANAERMVMTTRRFFKGHASAATVWNVYVVAPGR